LETPSRMRGELAMGLPKDGPESIVCQHRCELLTIETNRA